MIADTKVMLLLTSALSLFLYYVYKKRDAAIVFFSVSVATAITYSLKHIFTVPRPVHMLVLEDGYRFPSGHATMASVLASLTVYFSYTYIHNSFTRYVLCALAILWYMLISYARLYLGVHYVVDVVCGGIVGVISFLSTAYIIQSIEKKRKA